MRIVTLDIGGTAIKSGLYENGTISDIRETPTNALRGGRFVMEEACRLIAAYEDFEAVGISTAGQVDPEAGVITYANENIPGYTGMEIRRIIEEQFHVPVAVENDVNAAAIGESVFGAGAEYPDFLMATYGTGVGGAVVMDGKIYHGANCSAAEFGGIVTHPEAMQPGVIFSGCYEHYASATALVRMMRAYQPAYDNGRKIFEHLAEDGVRSIVDAWIDEIVAGLVTLVHVFNPSCVVLGGGIMAQPYVIGQVEEKTKRYLSSGFDRVKITGAGLENRAGMFGAASLAEKMISV